MVCVSYTYAYLHGQTICYSFVKTNFIQRKGWKVSRFRHCSKFSLFISEGKCIVGIVNPTYLPALLQRIEAEQHAQRMHSAISAALSNLRSSALAASKTRGLPRADRAFLRRLAR